jgi:hypothetical protein
MVGRPTTTNVDSAAGKTARSDSAGPAPGTVSLAGLPTTVTVGDTFSLAPTIVDPTGALVSAAAANWRSSAPDLVDVDSATGLITAMAPGEATIEADVAGKAASARLVVSAPQSGPIARIVVAPTRLRLVEGKKQQLTANLVDSANAPVIGAVTWQVEDTTIASVDATGTVTARKAGKTNVVATSDAVNTKIALTVAGKEGETDADAIRGQIEQFVAALNAHSPQRVQALLGAEDRQNAEFLAETFKRAGSNFRAAQLNVSTTEIGWTEASANFTVRASWKPASGAVKTQTVPFRATLEKGDGAAGGWKLTAVRGLSKLE